MIHLDAPRSNSRKKGGEAVMPEVVYRQGLKEDQELYRSAQQGTKTLVEILGPSADSVTAEWDRGEAAPGQTVIILRLSDFAGSVTAVFDPGELDSPARLRSRLRLLWGDLLRIRSHHYLQTLLGADAQES
jgi:hypothetical protein